MPEVTLDGQKKLKAASILCIGAGGLGSPILLYLAAAGIGREVARVFLHGAHLGLGRVVIDHRSLAHLGDRGGDGLVARACFGEVCFGLAALAQRQQQGFRGDV